MKRTYFVQIRYSKEDDTYYVDIPGLPGNIAAECATYGDTPEHARAMAKEYIELVLVDYVEEGFPLQEGLDKSTLAPVEIDETLPFVLWLRQQRKQQGLSQVQFAKLLGTNVKDYQCLENQKHSNSTVETLLKIRNSLNLEQIPI